MFVAVAIIGGVIYYFTSPSESSYRYLCLYHKDVMPEVKAMVTFFKESGVLKDAPAIKKKISLSDKQCVQITRDEIEMLKSQSINIKWEDLKMSEDECDDCKSLYFSCKNSTECQSGSCKGDGDKTCIPPQ